MKAGWQIRKFSDMCELKKGRKPALYSAPNNGAKPYLVAKYLRSGIPIEFASVSDRNAISVEQHEIIIICDGSNSGETFIGFDGILSSTMAKIAHGAELDNKFLMLFLDSLFEKFNAAKTGSAIPHLDLAALRDQSLPVPPLPEQHRIVALLDAAFNGIAKARANAEKNLQNARALFESHLQSVFTERGEGWSEKRLGEVCSFSSGGTPSKANNSYWSGTIPWISGRDMKSERLSDAALHISQVAVDESSTRMAPAGALLILVRGMGLAHGPQIGELMTPCAFNQDIRAIHPERGIMSRFLLFALRTRIKNSKNVLSNAAHGTLKIDMDALKNVAIPVPSLEVQYRITQKIDALSSETQRLESLYQQKFVALDALKKSLLHQAFSGAL